MAVRRGAAAAARSPRSDREGGDREGAGRGEWWRRLGLLGLYNLYKHRNFYVTQIAPKTKPFYTQIEVHM